MMSLRLIISGKLDFLLSAGNVPGKKTLLISERFDFSSLLEKNIIYDIIENKLILR